jgi:hypothetical protein
MERLGRPKVLGSILAVCLGVGLVAGLPASASSRLLSVPTSTTLAGSTLSSICTPARFQEGQQALEQEVSNRAVQLETLETRISNTKDISSADASTLEGIVSEEQTGITDGGIDGLKSVMASATTCAELITDAKTMVQDFWVYALVSPQVDLTAVESVESSIVSRVTMLEPKIESAISAAGHRGVAVSGAEAAYSDLTAKVGASGIALQAVSISTLLAQRPSDFAGDGSLLVGYHNEVVLAGADLRAAYEDLQTIVADLK